MFIFFLFDIIPPEIVYNIRNYLQPNFIERYYLGLLNKKAYDFYKQKLLKLKSIAYTMINPYVHIPDYNIIFDKYLSIVIHKTKAKYKFNPENAEYLDHVYDNNFIVIYVNDKLEIIKKEFNNCYNIEVVSCYTNDTLLNNNYKYSYILYDSYGIYHYEISFREAQSISLAIKETIQI